MLDRGEQGSGTEDARAGIGAIAAFVVAAAACWLFLMVAICCSKSRCVRACRIVNLE